MNPTTHAGSSLADKHHATLLAAALEYAASGWHVFPLTPGTKRPAAPRHQAAECDRTDPWCRSEHTGWEQRATNDLDRITRAWSTRPFGIGIATGPSRLLVVDTDIAKPGAVVPEHWSSRDVTTGEAVLADLAEQAGEVLPATWTVTTPSGGVHRYYRRPEAGPGTELGNSAGRLGWLIDTRARGGYVVAPPSLAGGRAYEVTDTAEVAELPAWITDRLAPSSPTPPTPGTVRHITPRLGSNVPRYVAAAVNGEVRRVRELGEGGRNHGLFCSAVALGQLVAGGALPAPEAYDALLSAASVHFGIGAPPFTEAEAAQTIRSGFRRGANNPRTAA
ncbi:hypothetical protein GCM10028784_07170 [Myceligenerans cantabricum]